MRGKSDGLLRMCGANEELNGAERETISCIAETYDHYTGYIVGLFAMREQPFCPYELRI